MNTNTNTPFDNIGNMLPMNLSELEGQFGDDYECDTSPVKYIRSTCDRQEYEMYDPRFDILNMEPTDPYFTPNPDMEALDAKMEQNFMEEDQDFMEAGEIYDPRFDILDMDLNDPYLTANPDMEALDAKMEQNFMEEERDYMEEERPSMDDEVSHFNLLHGTCFQSDTFEKLKEYANRNMISLSDSTYYSQSCHSCNTFFDQEDGTYGNTYCCDDCENTVEVYDQLCYYKDKADCACCNQETICVICSNPDKVALFNARYNQSFNEEQIQMTKEYVKEFNLCRESSQQYMTIGVAIEYMKCCHNCGNTTIPYGNMYCNKRCCEYVEDYRYPCFRKDDCILCGNNNYYESDDENLIATEDATILNMLGPVSVRIYDDDEWAEIEAYGEFYYLRKGFYKCVSSAPAPRDGYADIEIGDQWYVYRV